ncbi:uncharacterized protein LOC112602660 [Melanaphis sacchari]|uniref:uncharacterized protein LOC112602660 n=1 Tax=Melanaphis sacchari TaxID=742174 RepID=UPI000DC14961|nr:uncharacterized protein LOC112602660 [Melanaphis sacchari]XP_025206642.1 uncharacterized protein LOC112602660 [Melanaphis sacchari]
MDDNRKRKREFFEVNVRAVTDTLDLSIQPFMAIKRRSLCRTQGPWAFWSIPWNYMNLPYNITTYKQLVVYGSSKAWPSFLVHNAGEIVVRPRQSRGHKSLWRRSKKFVRNCVVSVRCQVCFCL